MKALIIVDMLYDFINPEGALYIGPTASGLTEAVKSRLELYRSEGKPVIYICDRHHQDDSEFRMFPPHSIEESKGAAIVDPLTPCKGEIIIYKRRFSAFFGTDLDLTLREIKITDLELAGAVTNICILYTAAEACMLNYSVFVSREAVSSFDQEAHLFALQEMEKTLGVKVF